jgi:hypothetical protein
MFRPMWTALSKKSQPKYAGNLLQRIEKFDSSRSSGKAVYELRVVRYQDVA